GANPYNRKKGPYFRAERGKVAHSPRGKPGMDRPLKPSCFVTQLAVVLDDNLNVPVAAVLAFEQTLVENPADPATRGADRDWLLENGVPTRAEQLGRGVLDQTPGEYQGDVRPGQSPYALDWADY